MELQGTIVQDAKSAQSLRYCYYRFLPWGEQAPVRQKNTSSLKPQGYDNLRIYSFSGTQHRSTLHSNSTYVAGVKTIHKPSTVTRGKGSTYPGTAQHCHTGHGQTTNHLRRRRSQRFGHPRGTTAHCVLPRRSFKRQGSDVCLKDRPSASYVLVQRNREGCPLRRRGNNRRDGGRRWWWRRRRMRLRFLRRLFDERDVLRWEKSNIAIRVTARQPII